MLCIPSVYFCRGKQVTITGLLNVSQSSVWKKFSNHCATVEKWWKFEESGFSWGCAGTWNIPYRRTVSLQTFGFFLSLKFIFKLGGEWRYQVSHLCDERVPGCFKVAGWNFISWITKKKKKKKPINSCLDTSLLRTKLWVNGYIHAGCLRGFLRFEFTSSDLTWGPHGCLASTLTWPAHSPTFFFNIMDYLMSSLVILNVSVLKL